MLEAAATYKVPPPRRDKSSAVATNQAAAGPSRPSFRPRPIDLAKPLPIIKSSKDLRNEDDVVVNRALPTIATGVDPSEEEERHLQKALLASVVGNRNAELDIPIPVYSAVKPPVYTSSFSLAEGYLIFDRSDADLIEDVVEYDADHEDDSFAKSNDVPIADVEVAMDNLEKLQAHGDKLMQWSAAKSSLADAFPKLSEHVREKVFKHWYQRREKHGRPFLRFYQPPPDPNDNDPAVAFRPRDREAGAAVAQRMNTYDNFRRASVLRDDLIQYRTLLAEIKKREQIKANILSMRLLQQRLMVTSGGGSRIDSIIRAVFPTDSEPVITYGNPSSPVPQTTGPTIGIVPCRGLDLPDTVAVETRRLSNDKNTKKSRRRTKATERRPGKEFLGSNAQPERTAVSGIQSGVDTFGFDEHGNRFLKHMRYFAGGFMNYGVSPYDHRVFAAASERNTVRALPREPQAVSFPNPAIRFARSLDRDSRGGKIGRRNVPPQISSSLLPQTRRASATQSEEPPVKKRRPVMRVRGRVGRGGRIMFDRVVYERERGVKAASYPASVEIGGVYTGDVPLDAARKLSEHANIGYLGELNRLALQGRDDDNDEENTPGETSQENRLARKLVAPLKPMVEVASACEGDTEVVKYWPRRRRHSSRGKHRPGMNRLNAVGEDGPRAVVSVEGSPKDVISTNGLRSLPAYAPRNDNLIEEL